ncbi:hypothetical protein BHE74_00030832 [Ensete ventricosum]|nr:hypothetical protein BHE74_00030832 [Ensete ventricosum]
MAAAVTSAAPALPSLHSSSCSLPPLTHRSLSFVAFTSPTITKLSSHRSSRHFSSGPSTSVLSIRAAAAAADKKRVLVINTNSGGHAVIGFYFAQQLLGSGHEVTVLTVGDESSDKMKKPPFTRFSVYWAKSAGVEQFLYISSAGIYKPFDEIPHVEGVCIPIPGSGMQLTNISHVRDLSSMLSLAVENSKAANGKIFNCVSDRAVTFDGLAKLCAQAAGRELKIIHYEPKAVGIDAKKAFPFRNMHFYAEPRAAKEIMGWSSTTNLPEDMKERFDEYVKIGRDKKPMQFDIDDKILESLKIAITV